MQGYVFVGVADGVEEGVPLFWVDHVDDFLGVGVVEYVFDFWDVAGWRGGYLLAMAAVSLVKRGCIWLMDNYKWRVLSYLYKSIVFVRV